MRSRSRLEAEITERLSRLSAEDMQRVAEDYARIRHPQRMSSTSTGPIVARAACSRAGSAHR
ncbi:MAG: hypothetical protein N838_33630 [Thiohalocapsa sp. PB-PSB1]|jgi:hypothetical protein|nr:MAG: hypothetical protein N838_33630 [Thiohalocapsa sp. PB-PSB1]